MDLPGRALSGRLLDGRYRVGAVIARGGMSTVYRGVDLRLGRPVAVKVLSAAFADDPAFLARFEREARAAAGLRHSGVVAVYDQGVDSADGGLPFLVMELVDGGTLRDLLRRGPLALPVALSVAEPLLGALAAAHAAGLIHRDVKPENVLISGRGEVKVADFGLVRAVSAHTAASGDVILGTVAYLSPEQVSTGTADARSDVYAAGIVLFEMLTGRPPFAGDTALSVAYAHVHSDVPPLRASVPGIPAEIDRLVLAATRRDPNRRPRDAGAFLTALLGARDRLGLGRVAVPVPRLPDPIRVGTAGPDLGAAAPGRSGGPAGVGATVVAAPPRSSTWHLDAAPTDGPPRPGGLHATRSAAGPGSTLLAPAGPVRTMPAAGSSPLDPSTLDPTTLDPTTAADPAGRFGPERQPAAAPHRPRWRRRLITLVVVAVLAAAAALGGWWLGSGRWASTPPTVGVPRGHAVELIEQAGLVPAVSTVPNNAAPAGQVVRSDPDPGTRALRGSSVSLVVSTGLPTVPEISSGATTDAAAAQLSRAMLTAVFDPLTDVYDESVPPGRVLRTVPAAGERARIAADVTLVRSRGPAPAFVPAVTGKNLDDARNALLVAGFRIGPDRVRYADLADGSVVGTDPVEGSSQPAGSNVSLVLATSLAVPDLRGRSAGDAVALLRETGFQPVVGDPVFDADIDAGQVAGTSPGPGSRVDPADPQVTVTVSDAITVPPLVGLSRQEAEEKLNSLGLSADRRGLFNSAGSRVDSQVPHAGDRVAPGSRVTLTMFL